jgi:hypothetical protein
VPLDQPARELRVVPPQDPSAVVRRLRRLTRDQGRRIRLLEAALAEAQRLAIDYPPPHWAEHRRYHIDLEAALELLTSVVTEHREKQS